MKAENAQINTLHFRIVFFGIFENLHILQGPFNVQDLDLDLDLDFARDPSRSLDRDLLLSPLLSLFLSPLLSRLLSPLLSLLLSLLLSPLLSLLLSPLLSLLLFLFRSP